MDRRFGRRMVLGAWLLLTLLLPWSARAQEPAPADVQSPEIAPTAAPSCARWTPSHIDCFVIGSDNRIWMIQWNDGPEWGGWSLIPQPPTTIDPAGGLSVTMRGLQVEIFAIGIDGGFGNLYRLTWTGSNWSTWTNLGGPGILNIYEVSCASTSSTNLECFARVSDNHLWQKSWNGTSWGGWTDLGGFPSSSAFGGLAATTYGSGYVVVYAIGGDGHAYRRYYTGAWSSWQDDGKPLNIDLRQVGCATRDAATIECAFTDIQGGAWYRRWTSSGGWETFVDLGFPPSSTRGVTVANFLNDGVVVLANASDERFYRRYRSPGVTTWSNWLDLGRPKDARFFIPHIIR